ncbi:RNA methyltransferase [Lacticaseibacillus paracasei]|jgi:RNA methyltransferase, TrmH family|uniref:23S rRNA methyltransferase n=2 Tax=Lacticaseibacillus paracasei TaxID=1597 RepID=A0A8E0IAD8_LACPA|nr:RNA methyltransferase [Lacticaseibacillus paracasei]EKQ21195.1 rRNA methylase [Lacticaseibacillus casei UW4]EPC29581.1 23S rRNA methyltransferase [Lacticaseibacillus paracasei subsp. paracasei Lpp22]OJF75322.1 RNA methyltransferase [Lacticaseibacillus casei]AKU34872.1 RNA methyltransferase [Lacticaseibacillus paracasei]ATG99066.1 RNA methyltransferase [Lacticaseibacillus paracasei]
MEYISSPKNDRIKTAKKLTVKKHQKDAGRYLLEGRHLVQEALASGQTPYDIYATEKYVEDRALKPFYDKITQISESVSEHLSDTQTPQGIFAVMPRRAEQLPEPLSGQFLLLDAIQDPGNVGTLVRTADAAGIQTVVFGNGTADAFGPKVLRAMQGSQFHVRIVSAKLMPIIKALHRGGIPVYGSELNEKAKSYHSIQPSERFALIVGNEGNGMDPLLLQNTDTNLYIPIRGKAESLNVAVAAAVMMFHLVGD